MTARLQPDVETEGISLRLAVPLQSRGIGGRGNGANCNPWDNRRAGDFMILWDQQGGSLDLFLRTWSGSGDNLTLSAPTPLNAAVSQAAYSADGFRGEAAVDLTATIFGGSTACRSFANTIPSTVTATPTPRTPRTRS